MDKVGVLAGVSEGGECIGCFSLLPIHVPFGNTVFFLATLFESMFVVLGSPTCTMKENAKSTSRCSKSRGSGEDFSYSRKALARSRKMAERRDLEDMADKS